MRVVFLLLLTNLSIVIILVVYHYNNNNPVLEYSQNRIFYSKSLNANKSYKLKNNFSLMKKLNGILYFVSWEDNDYNKIYFSDIDSISDYSYIELNVNKDKILISEYFIQDSIIEV